MCTKFNIYVFTITLFLSGKSNTFSIKYIEFESYFPFHKKK